jgi:hypothetical protein
MAREAGSRPGGGVPFPPGGKEGDRGVVGVIQRTNAGGFGGEIQRIIQVDRSGVPDGSGRPDSLVTSPLFVDV